MRKLLFKLYVTGRTRNSENAIKNLSRICDEELNGRYEISIIDILERPELAKKEKILATPTLIKSLPMPIRRVIGNLSNKEKTLKGIELELKSF